MILLFCTGLASGAVAGEPLSLSEAMTRARRQAWDVAAAGARAQAATARLDQAKGARWPSLRLEETWIRTDSPAEAFALKLNQERFSFADFVASDPNRPAALDTAMTRLELSVPLYTGGELGGRIAQASLSAESATDGAGWAANQAALGAAEAYVALEEAREFVVLLEHARATVKAHVDEAQAYVEQGMLVRSELLRAEVELSRVDDMLAEARGRERLAAASLDFRLAVDESAQFDLEPLPPPADLAKGLDGWLSAAMDRKDLVAARAMLRAGELEERVRRAAFLPRVGVVARHDLVDDRLFGDHGSSTALVAQAGVNLFAGGSDRAAVAAARWEAKAGAEDVKRFEEGVRLEVRQAYEEAVTARARYATAARALDAAREAERINEDRFHGGVVKMLDLLDASNARREAETRELVARADAETALLRLAVKAGQTPESVLP